MTTQKIQENQEEITIVIWQFGSENCKTGLGMILKNKFVIRTLINSYDLIKAKFIHTIK